jgi:cyclic pyranopterin monophosphate synthase
MKELSHVDKSGKANMVDVGAKVVQMRTAIASGSITLSKETLKLIKENEIKKGDVLTVAQIAGIQAAKQCPSLIPLCHPLQITKVDVDCKLTAKGIDVKATVRCMGQTGVEMEALTAVSIALLTVYDMCKAVDKNMIIEHVKLVEKTKI